MSGGSAAGPGELALVLHTHMPYVEGFGTWPFGEEWLFEAMATAYLPLLDVLDGPHGRSLTLSLTPVLVDQLVASGVSERFVAFLRDVRRASHRLDADAARSAGDTALAAELERAAAQYEAALARFEAIGGDLAGALGRHAAWTSSATHAVLPLLATDAGVRLQVRTGIAAHRERFGGWGGGFWSPECAHAPWLDPLLAAEGVRATCVELTGVFGAGSDAHLRPLRSAAGPLLVPVDRATIDLVWHTEGYPARPAYRDRHRRTEHHHQPWSNDGAVYDPPRAATQVRVDAAEFVSRVRARVAGGGLCVCALDTELLGHWWHEGPAWLGAVLEEADRQRLRVTHLDDALARTEPVPAPEALPATTWGRGNDLSTWDGPAVADVAWTLRRAELDVVAAGRDVTPRALRELLALQSSDWAFQVAEAFAGPYPLERVAAHDAALAAALADRSALGEQALRGLAPEVGPTALLEP